MIIYIVCSPDVCKLLDLPPHQCVWFVVKVVHRGFMGAYQSGQQLPAAAAAAAAGKGVGSEQ